MEEKTRCVSKIWASMLRRREFTELFLSKSYARPQLLFTYKNEGQLLVFSSPQPQNPDEKSPRVIPNYQMSFFMDDDAYEYEISVVSGLVCVINYKRPSNGWKETVQVICNPSTGKILKKAKIRRSWVTSMFGYDPFDKEFKILSTWGRNLVENEYQVLTLGTDKWRMLECCIPGGYHSVNKELCINGVLYYQSICEYWTINEICCFDIRSEKFSFIRFNKTLSYATLINYSGNLGLLCSKGANGCVDQSFDKRSTSLRLWVLEDVERQEWSKRIIVLPTLWKDMVGENILRVVGVTSTNEIVFHSYPFFQSDQLYLFYLNTDKNTIVRVEIQGLGTHIYGDLRIFMNHVEDVTLI